MDFLDFQSLVVIIIGFCVLVTVIGMFVKS